MREETKITENVKPPDYKKVGLPPRPFLYTIDQLGVMLDMKIKTLELGYLYFEGRSIGVRKNNMMIARNIAPVNQKAEWRVTEREFIRWMRTKGFKHYETGGFSS